MLVTALFVSLLSLVTLHAQAAPAYKATFTLAQPIQWNTTILQPGVYTISVPTTGFPSIASISTVSGHPVAFLRNRGQSDSTNDKNTLLLKEKNGHLRVYSLELAELGMILIYDPVLARQAVLESQANQTVPLILAKR
jgi:hypothetical protein